MRAIRSRFPVNKQEIFFTFSCHYSVWLIGKFKTRPTITEQSYQKYRITDSLIHQVSLTRDSKHAVKHVRMAFFLPNNSKVPPASNTLFPVTFRAGEAPLKASISYWDTIAYGSVDVDGESKHPRQAENADSVSQICFQSYVAIHSIKLQYMNWTKDTQSYFLPAPVKQHPHSNDAGQKNSCLDLSSTQRKRSGDKFPVSAHSRYNTYSET